MSPKVLVIGLDGASWELLLPWLEKNELQNLQKLIENGVSGYLKSSIPPLTFPAWKCYSTGKNPGKLGVYSLASIDLKNMRIIPNNSTFIESNEIWDYLSEERLKVGIINMPTTFPPKQVNGFMITGPFSIIGKHTFPRNFKNELDNYDYKIIPEYYMTRNEKDLDDAKRVISSRFSLVRDIIKKNQINFLHLTIFFTDTIQHFRWNSKEVKDVWKCIDENIGNLMHELDERWIIIIMSDHGFTKLKGRLYLNTWLERMRYLKLRNNFDFGDFLQFLDSIGIRFEILYSFSKKVGIFSILTKVISEERQRKIMRMIPAWGRKLEGMENKIDWDHSRVIPLAPLIYFNSNRSTEFEIKTLIKRLKEIKNPETGEKIIKEVLQRDEIYWGEFLKKAPDLIIVPNNGYEISDILKEDVEFSFEGDEWRGTHTQNGILIIHGPSIRKGIKIEGAEIFDLAPTILFIMDVAIPQDMDGTVLNIFEENLTKQEVMYRHLTDKRIKSKQFELTEEEEEKIKDKLRKLGYIA
ncbi:MAG: alkaline phosphatase family protein [Candidatus Hodarchaeota archaeon]